MFSIWKCYATFLVIDVIVLECKSERRSCATVHGCVMLIFYHTWYVVGLTLTQRDPRYISTND